MCSVRAHHVNQLGNEVIRNRDFERVYLKTTFLNLVDQFDRKLSVISPIGMFKVPFRSELFCGYRTIYVFLSRLVIVSKNVMLNECKFKTKILRSAILLFF